MYPALGWLDVLVNPTRSRYFLAECWQKRLFVTYKIETERRVWTAAIKAKQTLHNVLQYDMPELDRVDSAREVEYVVVCQSIFSILGFVPG